MKSLITLLLVSSLLGCLGWKEQTLSTLKNVQTVIVEPAQKLAASYLSDRCSQAASSVTQKGCVTTKPLEEQPVCKDFVDCLELVQKVGNYFNALMEAMKMATIAVTLDKEADATTYMTKTMEIVQSLYKVLVDLLPRGTLPDLFPSSKPPAPPEAPKVAI